MKAEEPTETDRENIKDESISNKFEPKEFQEQAEPKEHMESEIEFMNLYRSEKQEDSEDSIRLLSNIFRRLRTKERPKNSKSLVF